MRTGDMIVGNRSIRYRAMRVMLRRALLITLLGVAGSAAFGTATAAADCSQTQSCPPAYITGTVTDNGAQPLYNICVSTGTTAGVSSGTQTDSNGHYTLPVPMPSGGSGTTHVVFWDCNPSGPNFQRYLTQCYYLASCKSPTDVPITSGQTTPNINAIMGGYINGRITDPTGAPLANCAANAYDSNWNPLGNASTGPTGYYDIGKNVIPGAGMYYVAFTCPAGSGLPWELQYYDAVSSRDRSYASTVSVSYGTTTHHIDAILERQAAISGKVTDPKGQPVAGICVAAFGKTDRGGDAGNNTTTDSNGNYTITNIDANNPYQSAGAQPSPINYQVSFNEDGVCGGPANPKYATQWWSGADNQSSATTITLPPGQTTTGIDAQLKLVLPPKPTTSAAEVTGPGTAVVTGVASANGSSTDTFYAGYDLATSGWCTSGGQSGTPTYSTTPQHLPSQPSSINVAVNLTGLTPGTTYCAAIIVSNTPDPSKGNTSTGATITFIAGAPTVQTTRAYPIGGDGGDNAAADVEGDLRGNGQPGTSWAAYDLASSAWCASGGRAGTPAYNTKRIALLATGETHTIVHLRGLKSGTQYCAAIVASNPSGTVAGNPIGFTTTPTFNVSGGPPSPLTATSATVTVVVQLGSGGFVPGSTLYGEINIWGPTGPPVATKLIGYSGTMPVGTPAHPGATSVSLHVNGLRPHTQYYVDSHWTYRFPSPSQAAMVSHYRAPFETLSGGGVVLRSKSLTVNRGQVALRIKCAQQQACHGRFTITVAGKGTGRAAGGAAAGVTCASSRYKIPARKTRTVKAKLTHRCLRLLRKARNHTLKATFSVPKLGLAQDVRLRLRL